MHTEVAARMGAGFAAVAADVQSQGRIIPSALVEAGCRIGAHSQVGGRVVLERDVTVGAHTTVERAVVLEGATIGSGCTLSGCIVGAGVTIGDDCHVDGLSVLGQGLTLGAGNIVSNGARIFPGVSLPDGAIRF